MTAQFILTFDGDRTVADAAKASLGALDERVARAVLSDEELSPSVLEYLGLSSLDDEARLELLLLNGSTPSGVFTVAAATGSESIAELIAANHKRLLECHDIAVALLQNPRTLKSTSDRIVDLLIQEGVFLEGVAAFEEALVGLSMKDHIDAARGMHVPLDLLDERFLSEAQRRERNGGPLVEGVDGEAPADEAAGPPMLEQRLSPLSRLALVAHATRGNREVRMKLTQHDDPVVALAAIGSPLVDETEILEAASSTRTNPEVIDWIAKQERSKRADARLLRLALVANPEAPREAVLELLEYLRVRELKRLVRDDRVPIELRDRAAEISRRRR